MTQVDEQVRIPAPRRMPGDAEAALSSSERKHRAILRAAEELFLGAGFLGTNMDDVAAASGVSKQTVYKHFGSKEALFVELVSSMTLAAGDEVHRPGSIAGDEADVADFLRSYAERQLAVVLTPRLLQLRRLVIGEVGRFPGLARALAEAGPQRAIAGLADAFERRAARGELTVDDPGTAAATFNWLVMAAPLNDAMLLGDASIPSPEDQRRHAAEAVRVFLAAHGPRG